MTRFISGGPVIDHEFRQNIVTVAVDPRGDGGVDLLTTLSVMTKCSLLITGLTH